MKLVNKFNHPDYLNYISKNTLSDGEQKWFVKPGPFLPTNAEKTWLFHRLQSSSTEAFLSNELKEKTFKYLEDQKHSLDLKSVTIVKGIPNIEDPPHKHLRELRRLISDKLGMTIVYSTKNNKEFSEEGVPFKLQYNIAKKQWYLWWLRANPDLEDIERNRITPLSKIEDISEISLNRTKFTPLLNRLIPDSSKKKKATISWEPQVESLDTYRFFHAFSSFEKDVIESEGYYQMHVYYYQDEEKYLLSKIRLFGPHVRVLEPLSMQKELTQSAIEVLEKYEKIEELLS